MCRTQHELSTANEGHRIGLTVRRGLVQKAACERVALPPGCGSGLMVTSNWAVYWRGSVVAEHACLGEGLGDVVELGVGVLAALREQGERHRCGDLVPLHEDAFGLSDHVPAGQCRGDVVQVL